MFTYGKRVGVDFERVDAPSLTPSMRIALNDLKLDALHVAYPGRPARCVGGLRRGRAVGAFCGHRLQVL